MISAAEVADRVSRRLTAVAALLASERWVGASEAPPSDVAGILCELIAGLGPEPPTEAVWALLIAAWGFYPSADDTLELRRFIETVPPLEAALRVLDQGLIMNPYATARNELQVVTDHVVVDVGHTARSDLHTGIQKVVRHTLPRWAARHQVVPVGWTADGSAMCLLSERDRMRVMEWDRYDRTARPASEGPSVVVLPWRTLVVMLEVPDITFVSQLASVAQVSGNRVVAVGYDCIPAVRADERPPEQADIFTRYLGVLKYARRVAAISRSAALEFAGFAAALPPQGLAGPVVVACELASDPPRPSAAVDRAAWVSPDGGRDGSGRGPTVLCVGSLDPRKNHLAVLHAAEMLWREGLEFRLVLVSGSAWGHRQRAEIAKLQAAGRPLDLLVEVSDEELEACYRQARFSVFPSLHEGFGLPVTESLAHGTPVITTNYGGTEEAALGGGALLIDPRDDDELRDAMRLLLTDDAAVDRLRKEAADRTFRTADEYASDLWATLVEPELPVGGGAR